MHAQLARRSAAALACAVLLTLLMSATDAGAATIYACVKKRSGAARIVSAKAKCRHSERRLVWSVMGSGGAPGAPGLTGASGAAGRNGTNGSNGINGAVAGFSASEPSPITVGPAPARPLLSKTIPAGSFIVTAKLLAVADSEAGGFGLAECQLVDTPGNEFAEPQAVRLDVAAMLGPLLETGSGFFVTASTLAFTAAITTPAPSTLTIVCSGRGGGSKPVAVLAVGTGIVAVQTSQNG